MEETIKKTFIIIIAIITTLFYLSPWKNKTYSSEQKKVLEGEKNSSDTKGGKGNFNKKNQPETQKQRAAAQEQAIKEIAPYNQNNLTSGRRVTEAESRETRTEALARKKLLNLLKEKIDQVKIKKKSTRFTKGDVAILRKLEDLKKEIDEEENKLNLLINRRELKLKELSQAISDTQSERMKITKLLEIKKLEDERKLLKLVSILERIKPEILGPFLQEIDEDLFIAVVGKMKPKTFAKALKFVSKEKAVKLNEKFLTR